MRLNGVVEANNTTALFERHSQRLKIFFERLIFNLQNQIIGDTNILRLMNNIKKAATKRTEKALDKWKMNMMNLKIIKKL